MTDTMIPQVQTWLDRLNAGDREVEGILLLFIRQRWLVFARRALHNTHKRLEAMEQTEDLLSELCLRILQDWKRGSLPTTAGDFFRQTANNFGNLLVDLCRKHYGRKNQKRPPGSLEVGAGDDDLPGLDPGTDTLDPAQLTQWAAFHRQVSQLPEPLREVFQLRWYHELSNQETANALGLTPHVARARFVEARLELQKVLQTRGAYDLGG